MKRLIPLFVLALLILLPTRVRGSDDPLSEIYSSLPETIADSMPDGLGEEISEGNGAAALSSLDGDFFLGFITEGLGKAMSEAAPLIASLLFTVIVSSLISSCGKGGSESVGRALSFASGVAVSFAGIGIIKPLADEFLGMVNTFGGIMKVSLPVMTAICCSSGQLSSASVNATFLSGLLTLTEELGKGVLSPLISVLIAFAVVNSVSSTVGIDLSQTAGGIRKLFIFFISLIGTVLTVTLAFQSVIAKSADGILLRSIKFASGSSIPIVGAALSEAAGAYLGSLSLIKGSAGTLIAAAIALSALPVILKLFAVRLGLLFTALVSDMLGAKGNCIRDLSSVIDLMIALSALISTVFVIAAALFASVIPSV